jgi:hypothetical protein
MLPVVVTSNWSNAEDHRSGLFRRCICVFVSAGAFAVVLHGFALLKTSHPGRKRVRARITLFVELQGRVGPDV